MLRSIRASVVPYKNLGRAIRRLASSTAPMAGVSELEFVPNFCLNLCLNLTPILSPALVFSSEPGLNRNSARVGKLLEPARAALYFQNRLDPSACSSTPSARANSPLEQTPARARYLLKTNPARELESNPALEPSSCWDHCRTGRSDIKRIYQCSLPTLHQMNKVAPDPLVLSERNDTEGTRARHRKTDLKPPVITREMSTIPGVRLVV
ncbi:hypothetical protein C8F04DRAFT_1184827 [Mycena alexandri]|uniref:Uncharacterized protein n=1 Tax=Mycena alexandri TaxID=1745969 RepID=A0AAD6SS40_9AGAR|nr:hypothetical protein C8F04DRAFT_1184827 [Mycena alexandri]